MRKCGECTLCCKLLKVEELEKPSGMWCWNCDVGYGCRIYDSRPQGCRNYRCWWLDHPEMPEELRPDRAGMIAEGEGDVVKLRTDRDWTDSPVVAYFSDRHRIVVQGNQLTFLAADGLVPPAKIAVEWTL